MLRLSRAIEFSASLRYALPGQSERESLERFGEKARQHGYNYRLEVTLRGEADPVTGMVIDLKDLQEILDREVMARFDHRDLNADTEFFEKTPPTPENLVRVLRELLVETLPGGVALDRLKLVPESGTWVEWIEGAR